MAFNYLQGQVVSSDPAPTGATVLSQPAKEYCVKIIRLTSANFTTSGVNVLGAVLPADASISNIRLWVNTPLSGGGVTAPIFSIGPVPNSNAYASSIAVPTVAGTNQMISPLTAIMQPYQLPLPPDLQIWVRGLCSTGNPTAGEIFLIIDYVR